MGFRVLGFRVMGFRVIGFTALGFRLLGFGAYTKNHTASSSYRFDRACGFIHRVYFRERDFGALFATVRFLLKIPIRKWDDMRVAPSICMQNMHCK